MADVLFEITKDQLETGLRGYPVGYCTTSTVDPVKGLFYIGQPVSSMTERQPEEVIYLLYYGKEGSKEEVQKFSDELRKRGSCKTETLRHIRMLPRTGHPMKLFSAAILIAGMLEGKGDYREDCLNLIAKIPEITATVINFHSGWGENRPVDQSAGYIDRFCQMLGVPGGVSDGLRRVMTLFNILHYDHSGGNLSTFVGKAVASGLEDMYGSICAAMNALAGPRHGRANQDSLEFVQGLLAAVGENATPELVEAYIRKRLDDKGLIFGFGHAVLRVEDGRATILYDIANRLFAKDSLVKIANLLREVGPKVLKENPKVSDPYPNVDAISGVLLTASGFPWSEYFTVLFGMSRVVGIAIQIVYERCEARGGKGTPIVRPKYLYKARESS